MVIRKVFDYSINPDGEERNDYISKFSFFGNNYGSEHKIMIHLNDGSTFGKNHALPAIVMVSHGESEGTIGDLFQKLEPVDKRNSESYQERGFIGTTSMTMAEIRVDSEEERKALLDLKGAGGVCSVHATHPGGYFMVGGTTKGFGKIAGVAPHAIVMGGAMTHISLSSQNAAERVEEVGK